MNNSARTFEDQPATRDRVPLIFGLMGPSGGGKTKSALRLAAGMQRVVGGEVFVIDTESKRALHYAPKKGESPVPGETFAFRHVPFGAPFSPSDYLAAIQHCVKQGAKTIVVDTASLEHEGPGGVLEMHDVELERLGGKAADSFRAWTRPKADRRRLINTIMQLPCNFIFCFRAKDKTKPGEDANGKKTLVELGFMPIAGDEFIYEMGACGLLLPGANGVPTWTSTFVGEKLMIKLPGQFREILVGKQLSEDIGEQLARWAAGGSITTQPAIADASRATFRPKVKWEGAEQWSGKSLELAPLDTLLLYGVALQKLIDDPALSKHRADMAAHLALVEAAISNLEGAR